MDFIAQAKQGKVGRPIGSTNEGSRRVDARGHVVDKIGDSITNKRRPDHGSTSSSEARNRLRSEAFNIDRSTGEILGVKNPQVRQLYEDVLNRGKSPNAAAVEAGFRSPKVAVRLDDMHSAAQTLARGVFIRAAMYAIFPFREWLPVTAAPTHS